MRQQMDQMNVIPSAFNESPFAEPLPLGEAFLQLPGQYIKVILRPSARTFSEEMRTASWGMAIVQLCLLIVITVTLHVIGHFIPTSALHSVNAFSTGGWQPLAFFPSPYNAIAFILGSFLIGLGTAYFFSKTILRGQGTFLEHLHGLLLATVPLVTISGVLLLIPATGWLVGALVALLGVLFLYRMLLHVYIVMGVHGLGAGRATLVVLIIPMIVVLLFLLVMCLAAMWEGGDLIGGLAEGLAFWPDKKAGTQEKERRT